MEAQKRLPNRYILSNLRAKIFDRQALNPARSHSRRSPYSCDDRLHLCIDGLLA